MPETSDRNGWIKLHRELIDSKLWSCSDATLRVALYLMLEANHEPRYVRRVRVEPGQTVRSLTRIADDCHVSRKAARHAIGVLVQDGFLVVDEPFGAQQGHRLTVCKYESYQHATDDKGTEGNNAGNNEGNNAGNTNKKGENEQNEKNTPHSPPKGDDKAQQDAAQQFDQFRKQFPGRRRGNATEFANFKKRHKDWRECLPMLAEAVKQQKRWRLEMQDAGMFVPAWKQLQTWINQRCWEEEKPVIHAKGRKLNAIETDF